MTKFQWEHVLVELPFCDQLKAMGWQWIKGDILAMAVFRNHAPPAA